MDFSHFAIFSAMFNTVVFNGFRRSYLNIKILESFAVIMELNDLMVHLYQNGIGKIRINGVLNVKNNKISSSPGCLNTDRIWVELLSRYFELLSHCYGPKMGFKHLYKNSYTSKHIYDRPSYARCSSQNAAKGFPSPVLWLKKQTA